MKYRTKCHLLLGGFVFVLFVAWKISFSNTIVLLTEIKDKEKKLTWLEEKEGELPLLKDKTSFQKTESQQNDSNAIRDHLTAFISDFAEKYNCLVTEIPTNSMFRNESIRIQTNTFTIRGSFHQLLTLLNELESNFKNLAKIMSVRFSSALDVSTKRKQLSLTVITQSFDQ